MSLLTKIIPLFEENGKIYFNLFEQCPKCKKKYANTNALFYIEDNQKVISCEDCNTTFKILNIDDDNTIELEEI